MKTFNHLSGVVSVTIPVTLHCTHLLKSKTLLGLVSSHLTLDLEPLDQLLLQATRRGARRWLFACGYAKAFRGQRASRACRGRLICVAAGRGGRGAAREAVSMALENCVGQRKSLVFH